MERWQRELDRLAEITAPPSTGTRMEERNPHGGMPPALQRTGQRLAAGALGLVLLGGVVAFGLLALRDGQRPAARPDQLVVECRENGAPVVGSQVVQTRPDGVYISVVAQGEGWFAGVSVGLPGWEDDGWQELPVSEGSSDVTAVPVPPGPQSVFCERSDGGARHLGDLPMSRFEVVDPDGWFVDWRVDCASGGKLLLDERELSDPDRWPATQSFPSVTDLQALFPELEIEPAGYAPPPLDDLPQRAIIRLLDGDEVIGALQTVNGGRWVIAGETCGGSSIADELVA